jgi:Retroviral aspartyl protease
MKLKVFVQKKSHTRSQQPASADLQQPKISHNCQLLHSEFKRIQELSARTFDWDACCDDEGKNSFCKDFSSPAKSFFDADVCGKHVWLNPSLHILESSIEHFAKCYRKASDTTSACIVLPASMTYLLPQNELPARLLFRYTKGSTVYKDLDTKKLHRTAQPLHVYMIDARVSAVAYNMHLGADLLKESPPSPLAFTFNGVCHPLHSNQHMDATIMVDSGASARFVSLAWVEKHKLTIKKSHQNWTVTVANSSTVSVAGSVDVRLNIQGYQDSVKLIVIPMSTEFDIILGNDWTIARGAILNYQNFTTTVKHEGKEYVLRPTGLQQPVPRTVSYPTKSTEKDWDHSDPSTFVLNHVQAKRMLRDRKDWQPIELQHESGSNTWTEAQFNAVKAKAQPPTPEMQEADVRAAIKDLQDSIIKNTPADREPPAPDPNYAAKSAWLDKELTKEIAAIGDKVFRTELPGIRQHGTPVEAIPTEPNAKPSVRGMGRYSKSDREELDKQIEALLKGGMIEPSLSPYAAAALIVPKYNPDGSIKGWRMVVDYRLLNVITIKYQYPMPRVDDIIDSVNGCSFHHAMQHQDSGSFGYIQQIYLRQHFEHHQVYISGEYSHSDSPIHQQSFRGQCHRSFKRLSQMRQAIHAMPSAHSLKSIWTMS